MKTIQDFKEELGVKVITLLKGKGRMFANVGNIQLFVGAKTDMQKPLYVIKGKYEAMWLVNASNVAEAGTI